MRSFDVNPPQTELGTQLRQARLRAGLSLQQVGQQVPITKGSLSRIEHGEAKQPTAGTLAKLARILHLSEHDLLSLAGYPTPGGLPSYRPYLRARYDLPPKAIEELDTYFGYIAQKYGVDSGGPGRGEDEQAA